MDEGIVKGCEDAGDAEDEFTWEYRKPVILERN